MSPIEVVVARCTENLNWLGNLPTGLRLTVYDKGENGPVVGSQVVDSNRGNGTISLPNSGREAHTYLFHIINRYDSLAEWTVFCQGKPFDHAYDFKKTLRRFADDPASIRHLSANSFAWLGHLIDTDDDQGNWLFRTWSKNEDGHGLNLRGFHRTLFGSDGPTLYTFVLGAQFAIHRDVIRRRPLPFYERALAVSLTFPDAAHCFERSWDRVFGVVGIDPDWLAGRLTVYLKPMKYQMPDERAGEE